MRLKKKTSELRVVIILLLVIVMVCFAGIILYNTLSTIAKNVNTTINVETKNTTILKQILVEMREAENSVKTYHLTHNQEYLISFYASVTILEVKLQELKQTNNQLPRERIIIDSVVLLSEKRFELLKQQLYTNNELKITNELNAISIKIDEAFKTRGINSDQLLIPNKDTSVKKESFFKRLFRKKVKHNDTIQKTINKVKNNQKLQSQIQNELKHTVERVKDTQREKLSEQKGAELKLENEGKLIEYKIRSFTNEVEATEKKIMFQKIELANKDVNKIKTLAVIISIVISILLLIVSFLIINYVNKKREYELALIRAKQNAEDLAKAKETFLANMSHEIRTPLNAIYGFTEQVLNTKLNEEQYMQLSIVKKSANHLINLINDILDYSKIQAGKISIEHIYFNLNKELDDIKSSFIQLVSNKKLNLNFIINSDVPTYVNSDLTKIKQILYNLIGNAIKFTERGTITVIINNSTEANISYLEIQVKDSGIGISKEKISKLFNEYEQLHSDTTKKYGGTGLGLVITKKILDQMGGSIYLKSKENEGTEVTIKIPYSCDNNSDNHKNISFISEELIYETLRDKKILIVDDEEFNRLLLNTILSKFDLTISEAKNGNEAVDLIRNNKYDLVLMDIRMPEKNGIDACVEIRKFDKKLIIIASTAVVNKEKTERCIRAGFNGFIFKPFTEKILLENLMDFLNGNNVQSETKPKNKIRVSNNILNMDELISVSNGDEKFKKEMITIFHKSINVALDQIERFCEKQQWLEVSETAHKILPSCKHFEADKLYLNLKYFESLNNEIPNIEELTIKLEELKQNIADVNLELQLYL
jgi:signal transduction histidine kinase/response regulator of citrate/malate metabolism